MFFEGRLGLLRGFDAFWGRLLGFAFAESLAVPQLTKITKLAECLVLSRLRVWGKISLADDMAPCFFAFEFLKAQGYRAIYFNKPSIGR